LTPEQIATRKASLLPGLARACEQREPLSDGYQFRFAPSAETLQALFTAVDAERRCCRFLRFQFTVEPDGGPIWLRVTGPPGTREFLTALLDDE